MFGALDHYNSTWAREDPGGRQINVENYLRVSKTWRRWSPVCHLVHLWQIVLELDGVATKITNPIATNLYDLESAKPV